MSKENIKNILLSLFTILIGAFIGFNVWWTDSGARFLGLVAFFLIPIGSLLLSIALTKMIIPTHANISFSTLSDRHKYQILKNTIGPKKVQMVNICYLSLFFIFCGATVFGLVISANNHEKYQLMNYGVTQKVKIKAVEYKGKGSPYAFFDFYLDGKKYSADLSQKDDKVGDSAVIIFSTHNTDIVEWAEDFDPIE
ncbi:hypothetical protein [Chryseobacterium sp. OV279]|uniref:hypothetical protein n=1 Tax=Chryseobacterium sp. OV279 TaxID=1500285 RepID=UPI0009122867|nr:hypothetical protein [Chryseobacterium sp. OV279]SHG64915.1 hypothetical protein SAMN02787100_4421 [Chryseobacterium sp. OV279]